MPQINVLLVEDDNVDAIAFERPVEHGDADMPRIIVGVATSILDAKQKMSEFQYDLIILDLMLPDANELEGLKALRTEFPHIPIVVMSGIYSRTIAEEALRMGAQDYIVKGTVDASGLVRILLHAKLRTDNIRAMYALAS